MDDKELKSIVADIIASPTECEWCGLYGTVKRFYGLGH